ncbi:Transcription elongation factor S-II, central domain [Plasmopara halstedii]|uniref:Transcription elongation factor S-II, central domain n=1 Tax=Plasmopara halstedii TaxID=4781 RepID=A0A0P1B3A6_PLAHL|nr:Transcription elongation factor S-II, central domain [Plasmopara halstedii]CEG48430.1 Transcription elongation factor S-II, central domain [Plasmopara halstedii]|eukprot:XP_024584799.1 Transcription elongation factor S-II, central domain [Plasmopara halstedii]
MMSENVSVESGDSSAAQASLATDTSPEVQEHSTPVASSVQQVASAAQASSADHKPCASEEVQVPLVTEVPVTAEVGQSEGNGHALETPSSMKVSSKAQTSLVIEASFDKEPIAAEAVSSAKSNTALKAPLTAQAPHVTEIPSGVPALSAGQVITVAKASSAAKAASTQASNVNAKAATETMKVDTALAEETALKSTVKHKMSNNKIAAPRKRRTPSPTKSKEAEEDETESEPEKQPKKRAKIVKGTKKRSQTPGRRKKMTADPQDNADEKQSTVEKKVEALSDEIKGRFGQIVWAKMGGYPFWPCIITDPRLLPKKLQETALKTLGTKYLVFFYVSNNFAPISFKKIVPWDDTKFGYREGYPEKDSKAPKRRVKLMTAIEIADKEAKLPIEERANGILKPVNRITDVEFLPDKIPLSVKRKPGRPPKAKPALKTTPKKTPAKRSSKEEAEDIAKLSGKKDDASAVTQEEGEDADVVVPTLSKEEIKAKVASRKAPKKKEADDIAHVPTAKKVPKVSTKQSKASNSVEIDSKRKKEIELVVPQKSVKSADIREMTEEAAKKKRDNGPKRKSKKDKGNYNVGDLAAFANKMVRLHANESSRNNDELVGMMQELFSEELMYRSDVERSGLAAIIALLRKSLSPTVGHTASALRKHMINILNNDTDIIRLGKKGTQDTAAHANKKRKTDKGSLVLQEETLKVVPSNELKEECAAKLSAPSNPKIVSSMKNTEALKDAEVKITKEKVLNHLVKKEEAEVAPVKEPLEAALAKDGAVIGEELAEKLKETTEKRSASPVKTEVAAVGAVNDQVDLFYTSEHMEKNRTIFVDMLSKILDQNGSRRTDLASEIEAALYERFKESNGDYLTQARIIIFGLKENISMRKRLFSGALHCLEFAYADDAFFKASE